MEWMRIISSIILSFYFFAIPAQYIQQQNTPILYRQKIPLVVYIIKFLLLTFVFSTIWLI
jgi:hypothetical protein